MILAYRSIERAEVVLLVVDATEGPRAMDAHIARHILDSGRSCAILLNKWDIIEKDTKTFDAKVRTIYEKLVHLQFAPVISLSALTGMRCERIFEVIKTVSASYRLRVPTGTLNTAVEKWTQAHPPPSGTDGKRPRIYYATQTSVAPPHFVLFVSRLRRIPIVQYGRYIENRLREKYEFFGTPIRVSFRQRGKERSGGKSQRRDRLANKRGRG
jgi:GTP-binding protein